MTATGPWHLMDQQSRQAWLKNGLVWLGANQDHPRHSEWFDNWLDKLADYALLYDMDAYFDVEAVHTPQGKAKAMKVVVDTATRLMAPQKTK